MFVRLIVVVALIVAATLTASLAMAASCPSPQPPGENAGERLMVASASIASQAASWAATIASAWDSSSMAIVARTRRSAPEVRPNLPSLITCQRSA